VININNILTADRILLECNINSKKRALEMLSKLLTEHLEEVSAKTVLSDFVEREKLGSTALGHSTALPHIRIPNLEKPVAAFLQLHEPIEFDNDQNMVKFLFGLIVPEDYDEAHLHLLSQVAEFFHQENFREAIAKTQTPEEALQLFDHETISK
jgi:nitrogen PTS system EIIA component